MILGQVALCQNEPIPVRESVYDPKPAKPEVYVHHKIDLGVGLGLDYGGLLGIQLGYSPVKHLLLFASGGYHLIEFGWEVGAKGIILQNTSKNIFRPYLKLMYGNNAVIYVEDNDKYHDTYRGLTPGLGVQLRFGAQKKNGLDIDLNFPIHTNRFKDDYDMMKNDPSVEITQDLLPVAISVGFHHEF